MIVRAAGPGLARPFVPTPGCLATDRLQDTPTRDTRPRLPGCLTTVGRNQVPESRHPGRLRDTSREQVGRETPGYRDRRIGQGHDAVTVTITAAGVPIGCANRDVSTATDELSVPGEAPSAASSMRARLLIEWQGLRHLQARRQDARLAGQAVPPARTRLPQTRPTPPTGLR